MTAAHFARSAVLAFGLTLLAAAPAWHEESVAVAVPGGKLFGTLTLPSGAGPFPVALIIAGSGPTDRDGNGYGLQSDAYKLLAHDLAASGVATLRYDKRTIGQSMMSGIREQDLRFDMFVDDAVRLIDWLKAVPRFGSVSIIGHSEGSLIGILAAQRDPNVAAFVSLEGAGRNAADVIPEQLREAGAPPSVVATITRISNSLRAGKMVASVDPSLAALFRPSVQPYVISWFRYDPAAEIAKLHVPTLIVQGSTDFQVGVPDDARRLASADPRAKLVVINGMNHILRDAPADRASNVATYNEPSLPLAAEVVPAISSFILHLQ